jgi:hypothetical protein
LTCGHDSRSPSKSELRRSSTWGQGKQARREATRNRNTTNRGGTAETKTCGREDRVKMETASRRGVRGTVEDRETMGLQVDRKDGVHEVVDVDANVTVEEAGITRCDCEFERPERNQ